MPTLSQIPLLRLALLRRLPFWAHALALCALFAIVGVAVLDDYGVSWDAYPLRQIASANAQYITTGDITELSQHVDIAYRYYGMAFDMPLLLTERAIGLQDIRHINLTRHLLTHLLFIAGGFACAMLAYRMFGSRWIALLAMLMFLLHPRLYAHSFFNSKDIPFAALLAVALYLAHRAFRKDTGGAFLLCGIAAGLAINLRPFALLLPPMILAMRALDLWQADSAERKRVLASAGIFAAAALATMWIAHPHYWENPLRLIEGLRVFSQHPTSAPNLFMGKVYMSDAVPWNFIPVWFAITAPPVALALGAIGVAAVCRQTITRPLAALRDRETRFRILLLACVALPVAVVIALQSNIYNGWRHMYFLWTPFCLLAAIGLHYVANIRTGGGIWKFGARLPRRVSGGLMPALTYGATAVGLLTTLTAMAALHPYEHVYFNALVDTKTPGALAARYDMDYWQVSHRQLLEYLLARHPDDTLRIWPSDRQSLILPQSDRDIITSRDRDMDFYLNSPRHSHRRDTPAAPMLHSIEAYGSPITYIIAPNSDAYRDHYRAEYNDVKANGTLLTRSAFDIYAHNGALRYIKRNCAPLPAIVDTGVFLHIIPNDPADLPAGSRDRGFENRDFWTAGRLDIYTHTAFLDGNCITRRPLPDYPIAHIRTGQNAMMPGGNEWRVDIDLTALSAAPVVHNSTAGDYGQPVARSNFNLYIRDNALTYIKEPCAPGDADARFTLHIFPEDPNRLPADRREFGFANMSFQFADYGAYIGDICVAERELPDYPVARIRTGQKATTPGGSEWRASINLADRAAAQAARDRIAAGDYGAPVAQSNFDLYLSGNALTYIKEPCTDGDAHARLFLHIFPSDLSDLPADRRERGFVNLDFQLADHGAYASDICVATRNLPDYAIERVSAGQFVSGKGAAWRVEFPLAR